MPAPSESCSTGAVFASTEDMLRIVDIALGAMAAEVLSMTRLRATIGCAARSILTRSTLH